MNRRAFVTGLGTVLATPVGAGAQQAEKTVKLGMLSLQRLRELGHVKGQNLAVESR